MRIILERGVQSGHFDGAWAYEEIARRAEELLGPEYDDGINTYDIGVSPSGRHLVVVHHQTKARVMCSFTRGEGP
jgi:hypothetical protein